MGIEKIPALAGLKKEDTGGAGADSLTTGIDFLIDGAKTTPPWPNATKFNIHLACRLQAWHNLSDYYNLCWRTIAVRKKQPITTLNAFMSASIRHKQLEPIPYARM